VLKLDVGVVFGNFGRGCGCAEIGARHRDLFRSTSGMMGRLQNNKPMIVLTEFADE
jgi:hypothetical protein